MKHRFLPRLATAIFVSLAASVLAAPFGSAQLKPSPSPAGGWSFRTGELRGQCDISGDMIIRETARRAYSCTFKAVQTCRGRLPRTIHTEQSCIATQAGSEVTITSKVDKIVSVDPGTMLPEVNYAPDNFIVRINLRGDEMDGRFESFSTALVRFLRKPDLVS